MTPVEDPSGEVLLVAIVEMAAEHAPAGRRYEDAVLTLLERHGGTIERRMYGTDSLAEVHVIRFLSRAGYEQFMVDPQRLELRAGIGEAAPTARVLEVRDLPVTFHASPADARRGAPSRNAGAGDG